MMRKNFHLAVAALLLLGGPAWAALGGDLASVRSDGQAWEASHSRTAVNGATVHVQVLPEGITVRQYVDGSGHVFGVAWQGPQLPDFSRLLGTYYPVFQEAQRQQTRGVNVQSAELVIESGGMMRAFSGRAYLPGSLPATLTPQDIR